jgi:hypothetical protein
MQIVQIWSETESFDCAFDVLLDVSGRIGDLAVPETIETTFGGN